MAYIEYNCLQRFYELTTDDDTPAALRPVLRKLCSLYGLWSLSSHMATLYQGMHYNPYTACIRLDNTLHWC